MKLKNILIGCSVIIMVSLMSCAEDSNDGDRLGFIEASIDGVRVESRSATASLVTLSDQVTGFSISGLEDANNTGSKLLNIWFRVPEGEEVVVGNYTFDSPGCLNQTTTLCGWLHYQEDDQNVSASSLATDQGGTINVIVSSVNYEAGGHIKGSFDGTIISDQNLSKISVTNGSFDVIIED